MTGFFQQAPPLNSLQKRFIESIVHKHNVVGSFPLAYPTPSLYALAAMMNTGMAVVVCPDRLAVAKMGLYFEKLQYAFPDVAVLDGTQMPHEERETYAAINRNKVHLLLTTPDQFNTLNFLNMMVHALVDAKRGFVVVEQAHRLLPDFPGAGRYKKLIEGIDRLQQRPPLVLLAQPLPEERQAQLRAVMGLKQADVYGEAPLWGKTLVSVERFITEQQKFRFLMKHIRSPEPGSPAGKSSIVIVTGEARSAERVVQSIENARYGQVKLCTGTLPLEERQRVADWFASQEAPVVVCTAPEAAAFRGGKVFYWEPPYCIEAMAGHLFAANSELDPDVDGYLLHTREDYVEATKRLARHTETDDAARARLLALKRYRPWVLSQSCRRQTLAAYFEGRVTAEVKPCGVCDRCINPPKNAWQRLLEVLIY